MSTTFCYQHPDRPAVEQCEICQRPVCGSCLWYAESGERLCPAHAAEWQQAGRPVAPPGRYAAGIESSEISAANPTPADAPYRGNSIDLGALVAAVIGLAGLASCAGLVWALPFVAFLVGLVSWLHARDAVNPRRARWLAGLGLAGGALFFLSIFLTFAACLLFGFLPALIASGFRATPTPFPLPTP